MLIVALLVTLCGCDDRAQKEDIFAFVRTNEAALLCAVEKGDFSDFEGQSVVKDTYANERCVDFYCGGAGFGADTWYVGFFYTPNHDLGAMGYDATLLVPSGAGYEHQWSDNRYYVEHICGSFYYYEASY